MKSRRTFIYMALVAGALSGCAHATSGAATGATGVAVINRNFCPKPSVTLYVTNDNWLDMVIYIYRGSSRFRLGEVTGVQSEVFEIPSAAMGSTSDFAILADPIGSFNSSGGANGFATGSIGVATGGHLVVDLRLANILNQSSYSYGVEDVEVSSE